MCTGSCLPAPIIPGASQAVAVGVYALFVRCQLSPGWQESSLGFGELWPAPGHLEGEEGFLARHLAGCLAEPGKNCPRRLAGGRELVVFSLNRHRLSVEILETSDLLQSISRVVEGQREVPPFLQML